ncbi:MAG: glycosyltransferase family 4 protein [Patescibacteria group bacterium]
MRALIYDPYLDTAGGGERYMMTAAGVLGKNGYNVDVWWKDAKVGKWLEGRIGIDFSEIKFVYELNRGVGYDLVFWLSDGSMPLLFGGKNIIHFQTPFTNVGGKSLFNRLKRTKIDSIVCNSEFTKRFIDREYGVDSKVVYPPINTEGFKPGKKENVILFVGRYSQLQQLKRQDVLVETFKNMCDHGLKSWRLVLIGGSEVGGREFVQSLKSESHRYPIDILENLPLDEVKKYYAKSKIFWSASGYGVDEDREPHQVEHFGMSVVEAQSAGCVTLVVNKGGHKETIKNGENGFLWETTQELMEETLKLTKDERRRKEIVEKAEKSSKKFSSKEFEKQILEVFG